MVKEKQKREEKLEIKKKQGIQEKQKDEVSVVHALAYELKVEEVMELNVVSVRSEDKMSYLREILREKKISGTPVIKDDKLIGIISIEDLIRCLADGRIDEPIRNWMTEGAKVLYGDEQLIRAINQFNKFGFGRFPVVDRKTNKLVGILTQGDIVKGLLKRLESNVLEEEIHKYRASHIFEDIVADDVTLDFQYNVEGQNFSKAGGPSSNFKKTLHRLGIPSAIIRRVSIATYEAEMNIVVFTSGGKILACVKPDQIKVLAIDSGPGIPDIEKAMQPGYSTAPEWVRELGFGAGMGLCNIKKCSDKMDLRSVVGKGTNLEFIVFLNGGKK